jgi:hypothetical protein
MSRTRVMSRDIVTRYARAPVFWEDAARLADALGPAARRDLLRVLTSPSDVRADFIRQLHERPDGQEMADLLIFLEEWEWARQGMIEDCLAPRHEVFYEWSAELFRPGGEPYMSVGVNGRGGGERPSPGASAVRPAGACPGAP